MGCIGCFFYSLQSSSLQARMEWWLEDAGYNGQARGGVQYLGYHGFALPWSSSGILLALSIWWRGIWSARWGYEARRVLTGERDLVHAGSYAGGGICGGNVSAYPRICAAYFPTVQFS